MAQIQAALLRRETEAAGGATRARNETGLVEALAKALSGRTLSVNEATKTVLAGG